MYATTISAFLHIEQEVYINELILKFYRVRYGVQLEKGPFDRRTADFLWMMIFGAFALLVCVIMYISFSSYDYLYNNFPSKWWQLYFVESILVVLVW